MEALSIFVAVIFIVFGILQIVLFFKLWGTTDDVKKIKDNTTNSVKSYEWNTIRKAIALEQTEELKEIYFNLFFNSIEENKYNQQEFSEAKERLEKRLNDINAEMPKKIKDLNCYEDFENLVKY